MNIESLEDMLYKNDLTFRAKEFEMPFSNVFMTLATIPMKNSNFFFLT